MCGRFSLVHVENKWLKARFNAELKFDWPPRYNLAPNQVALTIISSEGSHLAQPMLWGFVPAWAKEGFAGVINARAETAQEKPMFRASFKTRRCLILADSFYEWKKTGGKKIPYRILLKGGPVFSFAGLYDEGAKGCAFAILTTQANPLVAEVHDRMPVILDEAGEQTWLDGKLEDLKPLFRPFPAEKMEQYPVSDRVNSWKNDSPECFSSG